MISIGYEAFSNTNISTITIPEGVTSIGNYCFTYCSSLTSIQLPSSLLSIGNEAFRKYYGNKVPIKQIEVPKNCKIKKNSFEDYCEVIRKWNSDLLHQLQFVKIFNSNTQLIF